MIRRMSSDLPTFKTLDFFPGLNVLLADKSPGATDRQTRNGAGKTSFVELVHFLLGGNAEPSSIFRTPALVDASFAMDFDVRGAPVRVSRSGRKPSRLVVQADGTGWPARPATERATGEPVLSNEDWKVILGTSMFGLAPDRPDPSVRSLLSYFARRQGAGGFTAPTRHTDMQQLGDQQVAVSFLIGIDWTIPSQLQAVRERERSLRELRKAAGEGALRDLIGAVADLRTRLAVSEERTRSLKDELSQFRVLGEYHSLEIEASELTRDIAALTDDNALDRQLLGDLEATVTAETPPAPVELDRVYREAGVVLPAAVLRRFEDVRRFHESVVRNRASYLAQEIDEVRRRVQDRERRTAELDIRRSQVMGILQAHGALEHFTRLQSELTRCEAETEALRQRFQAAELLETSKAQLDRERMALHERLQRDYHEEELVLREAILAFEAVSRALYEDAGSLTIKAGANGPEFDVKIHGAKSKGIQNMQIFCFDMMLMRLSARRGTGPGFLIHDSHLFDGVDERQVAKALQVGAQLAKELGFQYLVTMNSDAVPQAFPPGFDFKPYVLPIRLTDATETGGLFGLRFQ
ncbi:MAG: ABC-three component system protein [Patescibacteria group bacterium]